MNKKWAFALLIILFIIIPAGCGEEENDSTPTPTSTSTITPAPTDGEPINHFPTPIPTSVHYEPSKIDPAPFGSTASIGTVAFTIVDLIRPATEKVLAASSANPKPEEGMEYVLITVSEDCVGPTHLECFINVDSMKLIGSVGIERRPQTLVGIHFMLWNRHLFGGTAGLGYVAFIVDQNEEDLVFYYESDSEGTVYLSTE